MNASVRPGKDVPTEGSLVYMPGEGKSVPTRDVSMTYKAVRADTNGAWMLVEYTAPPHFAGPPSHRHEQMLAGFYILSGTLTIQLEERLVKAPAGSFLLVPPGVVHKFSNEEVVPATFLIFISPAGTEQELATWITPPPESG
ncbi:MAG: cupin domain-containing protein [Anaerolineales bacterium]|nr:cupin domain-containing protein [Anaerolineales bacterium]